MTKALQRENIDLSSVRALSDETCRKFKNIDKENKYLGSNARVIKSRHFESGVIKILEQRANDLVFCEKIACARLKKTEGEPEIETHSDNFASMILKIIHWKSLFFCNDSLVVFSSDQLNAINC